MQKNRDAFATKHYILQLGLQTDLLLKVKGSK